MLTLAKNYLDYMFYEYRNILPNTYLPVCWMTDEFVANVPASGAVGALAPVFVGEIYLSSAVSNTISFTLYKHDAGGTLIYTQLMSNLIIAQLIQFDSALWVPAVAPTSPFNLLFSGYVVSKV